jgi:hypothetical protein
VAGGCINLKIIGHIWQIAKKDSRLIYAVRELLEQVALNYFYVGLVLAGILLCYIETVSVNIECYDLAAG